MQEVAKVATQTTALSRPIRTFGPTYSHKLWMPRGGADGRQLASMARLEMLRKFFRMRSRILTVKAIAQR